MPIGVVLIRNSDCKRFSRSSIQSFRYADAPVVLRLCSCFPPDVLEPTYRATLELRDIAVDSPGSIDAGSYDL